MYSVYFAPRGKQRLLALGHELSQRHLSANDNLIGVIGDAGAGKSLLIKGMFPGLELTNDDEGINIRPLPLLRGAEDGRFGGHTFHVDVRFEMAFTQMHVLVDAVKRALDAGRRVIVEHFDLIYPHLGMNAEILVGIGEEVIVTRPTVVGPEPQNSADIVFKSIKYRKMAHTAEDLASKALEDLYGFRHGQVHGDVRHGFLLEFTEKPKVDLDVIEQEVLRCIREDSPVSYLDENHIRIGECGTFHCTGPRIHVRSAGQIEGFHLVKEILYDPISKVYAIVGLVGFDNVENIRELNKIVLR
jgi:GTPase SAR1 family protein